MPVNIRGRHFLKLIDYTPAEIRYLLDLSRDFKNLKRTGTPHRYLEGKNVVLLFEKTSTRTRCAFEVAGRDLGMGVTYLDFSKFVFHLFIPTNPNLVTIQAALPACSFPHQSPVPTLSAGPKSRW